MHKSYFLLITLSFLFSSCLVLHRGEVGSNPLPNPNVSYVDIARGNSKSVFVFGLGNLKNEGLVVKAKYDMYRNRPLKENEFYSNFTTSITDKYIFLFAHVTRVNVSADVLKLKNENQEDAFSENFKNIIWQAPDNDKLQNHITVKMINGQLINIGDTVYYAPDKKKQHYKLYTISSLSKESVLLTTTSKNYENIMTTHEENKNSLVSYNLIFLKNTSGKEYKYGDNILVQVLTYYNGMQNMNGTVLGCGNNDVLVKTKNGVISVPKALVKKTP